MQTSLIFLSMSKVNLVVPVEYDRNLTTDPIAYISEIYNIPYIVWARGNSLGVTVENFDALGVLSTTTNTLLAHFSFSPDLDISRCNGPVFGVHGGDLVLKIGDIYHKITNRVYSNTPIIN
jgi:hypothetical protein